jgi:hypothetical protein
MMMQYGRAMPSEPEDFTVEIATEQEIHDK